MNTALLVDGGHIRSCFKRARIDYSARNIENFCARCFSQNGSVYRIFYYDAPHFDGDKVRPVSGDPIQFRNKDKLLTELGALENFAIRKGRLKWAGWKLKPNIQSKITEGKFTGPLEDQHFSPDFVQKGVDMVLGLDVAMIANTGRVDQFMIVTADTDMAPALKHGRVRGLKAVLIKPTYPKSFELHHSLKEHADIVREVSINPKG